MKIDEKNAKAQSQYGGKKYRFCSEECKEKFEQHPEQYAQSVQSAA